MPAQQLNKRELALLDFERDWSAHEDGKLAAMQERFGLSSSRYYQLLAELIESEAAMTHDPLLVRRMRRRRRAREAAATEHGPMVHRRRGQTK